MKHLNKILIAVVLIMGLNTQAQDSKNPWAFSFGANAIDTKTSAGGGNGWADGHFSQLFAVKNNWNMLSTISYVSVSKYLGDNFSFGVSGSLNKIDKLVEYTPANGYVVNNPGNLSYYGIDATLKYSFQSLIKSKIIDPSVSLGLGFSTLGDNNYRTVNPGAGVTLWFSDNVGLELATRYKKSFGNRGTAVSLDSPSFFQHSLGLVFKFGEK
jgi:hypothetical protein